MESPFSRWRVYDESSIFQAKQNWQNKMGQQPRKVCTVCYRSLQEIAKVESTNWPKFGDTARTQLIKHAINKETKTIFTFSSITHPSIHTWQPRHLVLSPTRTKPHIPHHVSHGPSNPRKASLYFREISISIPYIWQ